MDASMLGLPSKDSRLTVWIINVSKNHSLEVSWLVETLTVELRQIIQIGLWLVDFAEFKEISLLKHGKM